MTEKNAYDSPTPDKSMRLCAPVPSALSRIHHSSYTMSQLYSVHDYCLYYPVLPIEQKLEMPSRFVVVRDTHAKWVDQAQRRLPLRSGQVRSRSARGDRSDRM